MYGHYLGERTVSWSSHILDGWDGAQRGSVKNEYVFGDCWNCLEKSGRRLRGPGLKSSNEGFKLGVLKG